MISNAYVSELAHYTSWLNDSLYREAEGNCSTVEQLAFTPLEPIRCPGLVSKRPERLEWSSENKLDTQGALARAMSKLRNWCEA